MAAEQGAEPGGPYAQEPTPSQRPEVPRWLGQLAYAFVLSGVVAGLAVVATGHFRRGSVLMAAAVLIGALARLVLPPSQVGMLAVRRKWVDVLLMVSAAGAMMIVAFVAKGTTT